jgi:hypothetical protein
MQKSHQQGEEHPGSYEPSDVSDECTMAIVPLRYREHDEASADNPDGQRNLGGQLEPPQQGINRDRASNRTSRIEGASPNQGIEENR